MDFRGTQCATVDAYDLLPPQGSYRDAIAFVDYYPPSTMLANGVFCPYCGTKSMVLNTRYTFSLTPQPNQYDIQSIMAHEFGHILGVWHMTGSNCGDTLAPPHCSQDPNRNTMGRNIYDAETCERDLSFNYDIVNVNSVY